MRKCKSDCKSNYDIVKCVFYAIVVCSLCSHLANISGEASSFICNFVKKFNESIPGEFFLGIGFYAYITLYFHDECKYGDLKYVYINENPFIICLGWTFFLLQAIFIMSLKLALLFGGIGVFIITIGLFFSDNRSVDNEIKAKLTKVKIRYVLENVVWMGIQIVSIFCSWSFKNWMLLIPLIIIICRVNKYGIGEVRETKVSISEV
jgi:hypothetical protein